MFSIYVIVSAIICDLAATIAVLAATRVAVPLFANVIAGAVPPLLNSEITVSTLLPASVASVALVDVVVATINSFSFVNAAIVIAFCEAFCTLDAFALK